MLCFALFLHPRPLCHETIRLMHVFNFVRRHLLRKKHATTPSISDTCLPVATFILCPLAFTIYYIICFLFSLSSSAFNFSFICTTIFIYPSIPSIQHHDPSTLCVAQVPPAFFPVPSPLAVILMATIPNGLYPDLDESWAMLYLLFNYLLLYILDAPFQG